MISPILRFQEYTDSWTSCTMGDVTEYVKGFAFKSGDYSDQGIRIIRVSDLGADSIREDSECVFINPKTENTYTKYKIRHGFIIITTVGSKPEMVESAVGRGIYVNVSDAGLLNQNLLMLPNSGKSINGFIIGYLSSKKYQHYIKGIARGNANQANITVLDLFKFKIATPSLPEQQKIAAVLSAADKKIQQLQRKKELLEQYKKGVMQKIFSQEIRFKDENGNDYPDWEECKIGDIGDVITGSTPPTSIRQYYNGDRLFVSPADIQANRYVTNTKTTVSELGFNKGRFVKKHSVLFVCIGSTIGKIAQAGVDCITNQQINSVIPHDKFDASFVYSVLQFNSKRIKRLAGEQAVPLLNKSDFAKLPVLIPTLHEQQYIGEFLDHFDSKIEYIISQIFELRVYKKGLLQQMFV
jgi:type I restriction enzyme, S subunit